jgi:hypothetical protein
MADMIPQGVQREGINGGYERGDANIRIVGVSMLIILSIVLLVMLVISGMSYALQKRESARDIAPSALYQRPIPPEPRLLPSPLSARDDMYPWERYQLERQEQLEASNSTGYTDEGRTLVTIPVDRALELVANENLPARQPRGADQPNMGEDLAGLAGKNPAAVADSDLDGSMVPDTTGGRSQDDLYIQHPSLGVITANSAAR